MTRPLRFYFALLALLVVSPAFAQFPYTESFRNAVAPGITFGGEPVAFLTASGSSAEGGTPIDTPGEGYLRLTNNTRNQKGFIYSNAQFPSTNGLRVEFEYYIYGGSGADGISLFLFDATAEPFNIGGFGGSLGYAQISTTTPTSPGVSKGYLAIGLDEFGNFSNPTEGRQGGIPGLRPGSVTLRGKGDGAAQRPDNYPFLTTVRIADLGFGLVGDSRSRQPSPTSAGYRRVFMDLEPNPAGGYNITVRITRGGTSPVTTTVIDGYHYAELAPPMLRYGIASSTGNQTNYHEIRNVFIDVYDIQNLVEPLSRDDDTTACAGQPVVIDIAANDSSRNENGAINRASIDLNPALEGDQSFFTVEGRGVFIAQENGTVTFTPSTSFTGAISVPYTIRDTYGLTSAPATLTVTYAAIPAQPTAGADSLLTTEEASVEYALQGSAAGANTGAWSQVSGPATAVFENPTSNTSLVSGLVEGVYVFRWTVSTPGGCELFDEVQITVDRVLTAPDLNIDVLAGEPYVVDIPVPPGASIVITTNPQHGTVSIDPVTGMPVYTADEGYTGPDDFTYIIVDGSEQSSPGRVIINVSRPARIGLAKALSSMVKNPDGSYNVRFIFTLVNYGDHRIREVSLTDDLAGTFPGSTITVLAVNASGDLQPNNGYNGNSDTEMLLPASSIQPRWKEQVELELRIGLNEQNGTFYNTAFARGISENTGSVTDDQSTNGLSPDPVTPGDPGPSELTPVRLVLEPLFIPGGFSPNNDGINDFFVIENSLGRKIWLEVYNRWGNRLYRSKDYQNNWNGKSTEGIHVGEDVPAGTYYYIIGIEGREKVVGYITISR